MWRAQSLISKHQAEFTTLFQVFVLPPLPLLPLFPVIIKKDVLRYESLLWPALRFAPEMCPQWSAGTFGAATARWVRRWIFSGLLFVTSGRAVIDYEIQRRAFGRHTSPLARCLTTIDFLGPCLRWCIKRVPSSPWYKVLLTTHRHSHTLSLSLSLSSCSSCLSSLHSLLFCPPPPPPLQWPYLCCLCAMYYV